MDAHRASWIMSHGGIPDGLCVLHRCDNRRCINIDHLFLGTKADNSRDMVSKGRSARGERQRCAKLTNGDVVFMRKIAAHGRFTKTDIARMFSVTQPQVGRICSRKHWAHVED